MNDLCKSNGDKWYVSWVLIELSSLNDRIIPYLLIHNQWVRMPFTAGKNRESMTVCMSHFDAMLIPFC